MLPHDVMKSMTHDEFSELEAYDMVMPLDHTPRMLGLIAYMIAKYLEMDFGSDEALEKICMPWLPPQKNSSKDAIASLSVIAPQVRSE
tara:strand:- start:77 stop:340 length:264 start_codon:yes stop_codon:yes gene_type:complete